MRFNLTRHKLLGKLAEKYVDKDMFRVDQADVIGLNIDEIDLVLGKQKKYRNLILSELAHSKEIHSFNLSNNGFFITPSEGLSAFSEKKYIRKNNDIFINFIKTLFEILIPVLALTVAVLTLLWNQNPEVKDYSKEIENNANSLRRIELQLKTIKPIQSNLQSNSEDLKPK
ncbi:hypothetical protein VBZ51_12010 [Maribacter sp. HS]|uniref:hypothetical protein n=1 Tax=Maribacter sp. HS TaxID=3110480 RepID=UPI003A8B7383